MPSPLPMRIWRRSAISRMRTHRRTHGASSVSRIIRFAAGCRDAEYACDNGQCISPDLLCDHNNDCGDLSDETWPCSKSTHLIYTSPSISTRNTSFIRSRMNIQTAKHLLIKGGLYIYASLTLFLTLYIPLGGAVIWQLFTLKISTQRSRCRWY